MNNYGQYTQNAIRNFLADNLPSMVEDAMTSSGCSGPSDSLAVTSRLDERVVAGGARRTTGVYCY